jgi:hypothetical protein
MPWAPGAHRLNVARVIIGGIIRMFEIQLQGVVVPSMLRAEDSVAYLKRGTGLRHGEMASSAVH